MRPDGEEGDPEEIRAFLTAMEAGLDPRRPGIEADLDGIHGFLTAEEEDLEEIRRFLKYGNGKRIRAEETWGRWRPRTFLTAAEAVLDPSDLGERETRKISVHP